MFSMSDRRSEILGRPPLKKHIEIKPLILPRVRRRRIGTAPKWFGNTVEPEPERLVGETHSILLSSNRKGRIFPDPNMYFLITFSDSFKAPIIRKTLATLGVEVVESVNDTTAKVSLLKEKYEFFLEKIKKNASRITEIKETSLGERIDGALLDSAGKTPDVMFRVNIEIARLRQRKLSEELATAVSSHVESIGGGTLREIYRSDRFILLGGELQGRFIREIAYDLDAINRIDRSIPVELKRDREVEDRMASSRSAIAPTESLQTVNLPRVCIIDSGLNRAHQKIAPYVLETFDFYGGSCQDTIAPPGHGSMVAGLVIYQGDLQNNKASCGVYAVRVFSGFRYDGDILESIDQTTRKFADKCRIYNLSFASTIEQPATTMSRMLDDLAFKRNVLFVVAAGNIHPQTILDHLQANDTYPDYLLKHQIFWPGDCFNVLTVGSFAQKGSTFVPQSYPSPFTRSGRIETSKLAPEVLMSGGNYELRIVNGNRILDQSGLEIASTSNQDSATGNDIGTSFACPTVASIIAQLAEKFPDRYPCFYKALLASSCYEVGGASGPFSHRIQGFGIPNKHEAMDSEYFRVKLYAQSTFDLGDPMQHQYNFPFPEKADRFTVTVCFDVDPVLKNELPYDLRIRLHKPGTSITSKYPPDRIVPEFRSNIKIYEFSVKRGGRYTKPGQEAWTLYVDPRITPALFLYPISEMRLRYALIVTIFSDRNSDVYRQAEEYFQTKATQTAILRQVQLASPPSARRR